MTQFKTLKPTDKISVVSLEYENIEPWEFTEKCKYGYITFEDLIKCVQTQLITPNTIFGPGSNNYNRED